MNNVIEKRKGEHIEVCLHENVNSSYNYWDDINLVHEGIPEIDKDEIETKIKFSGKQLSHPIFIAAISGGHELGRTINENCAKVAAELGLGFCIGSQRATFEKSELTSTYDVIKNYEIPIKISNIGVSQLVEQKDGKSISLDTIRKLMNMIDADMLMIHLNYPQEMIQPEGNDKARGVLKKIEEIARNYPVLVKECGAGISKEVAEMLKSAGVKGIEVSGVSGTSWTAVECHRARMRNMKNKERAGKIFWDWGVPSPVSVLECRTIKDMKIIGSGGIRHGLDVARAIALGADAASMAKVLLADSLEGYESVKQNLENIIEELKIAMFLTGSNNVEELKKARYVITGKTKEWTK
ncbi:MAG: type 2 isopentenyl-diphosphate Delta-isomerase [Candidatus Aenigmatarchaeota archaeon]